MELHKLKRDLYSAIFFIAFSIGMVFYIIPNEVVVRSSALTSEVGVSAQTFPYFASYLIGFASILLLIVSILKIIIYKKEHDEMPEKEPINWANEFRAIAVFGLFVLYCIVYMLTNFILASVVALPLILLLLKDRKWQHYVAVEVLAVVVFITFRYVLNILL